VHASVCALGIRMFVRASALPGSECIPSGRARACVCFRAMQVSRLTPQKGVPLIKHCAYRTTERGGQFVLLGSAPDPKVQVRWC